MPKVQGHDRKNNLLQFATKANCASVARAFKPCAPNAPSMTAIAKFRAEIAIHIRKLTYLILRLTLAHF